MTGGSAPDAGAPRAGGEALLDAVRAGDAEAVRVAVSGEPSLAAATDEAGVSAVRLALYHRQPAALEALLAVEPALDVFDAAALGRVDVLEALLADEPAAARSFAGDGFTALHLAAFLGGAATVRLLLAAGADADAQARNASHVRPLHSAAAGHDGESVGLLLEAGADPNAEQTGGFTPLHSAALAADAPMVEALLAAGADAGARTDDGRDALALVPADAPPSLRARLVG